MRRVQLRYTLVELAIMLDQDVRTVARWLTSRGVPIERMGKNRVVWIADLSAHIPEFERSLTIKREFDSAS